MDFSPWVLFTDIGLISLLLLVGTIIRAKVKFIQQMFLPASIIAGLLALLFGPNGLGILPFSDQMGLSGNFDSSHLWNICRYCHHGLTGMRLRQESEACGRTHNLRWY